MMSITTWIVAARPAASARIRSSWCSAPSTRTTQVGRVAGVAGPGLVERDLLLRPGQVPESSSIRPAGPPLASLEEQDRERGEMRVAAAALRLALNEATAATAALAPVLDGSASVDWPGWLAEAFLLEAMARDALGDPAAARRALERALDLAEPDGLLSLFLLHPAPSLLERYARHLTAHASLAPRSSACWRVRRPCRWPPGSGRCSIRSARPSCGCCATCRRT
jgi:hypothetical protein